MKEYLKIANDPILWLMCLPVVVLVAVQAVIFTKRAFQTAHIVKLTKEECWHAFRVGAISAIGPAIAVFIVMLGMMAVVGAPVTWMRLAIIGAAPTELTASAMAVLVNISKKIPGLTEYNLGIAMLIGMFTSVLIIGF